MFMLKEQRVELGKYIVSDANICHGKPTIKGTRIMVSNILGSFAINRDVDEVLRAWGGRVCREAIIECLYIAGERLNHFYRYEAEKIEKE